ncbi:hypothetical protein [Actinophytocola sediminis]
MDNRDLTRALRAATEDLEPRLGFTDDVVTASRRRRTRNRITVAAAVTGTLVVAAVVVAVPSAVSAPPSPGASTTAAPQPKDDWRMTHLGGEHIDDALRVTGIVEAWQTGLRSGQRVNRDGGYDDRTGDPHVYWAGDTPYGEAAIVVQPVRLGHDEERVLTGLVAAAPGSPAPRLLGVQEDDPGEQGHFVLPDDRTVLAVAHPDSAMWVSPEIDYTGEGSRRDWTSLPLQDGVGMIRLPAGTNPLNVRLIAGGRPERENMKLGGHLPLVLTSDPEPAQPVRRGLPWDTSVEFGDLGDLFDPDAVFAKALRDSGLLDPSSYQDQRSPWLIATRVTDGVLIIGEEQELDHPAYLYAAMPGRDGRYVVERMSVADPDTVLPVVRRLPDSAWLVAAFGKPLRYRASPTATWSPPAHDATLLPPEATQVLVDDQVVTLP